MNRPKPTKQLIIEECGGDHGLISSLHHGLYEMPMNDFYPYLDLDEMVQFIATSWKSRSIDLMDFRRFLDDTKEVYDVFMASYEIGIPWLEKNRAISQELSTKHKKMNPFKGRFLRQRLERVDGVAVAKLMKSLRGEVNEYVFECQYSERKRQRGSNRKLRIMEFQTAYPRKGRIVPAFASEVSRMISCYSTEYITLSSEGKKKSEGMLFD